MFYIIFSLLLYYYILYYFHYYYILYYFHIIIIIIILVSYYYHYNYYHYNHPLLQLIISLYKLLKIISTKSWKMISRHSGVCEGPQEARSFLSGLPPTAEQNIAPLLPFARAHIRRTRTRHAYTLHSAISRARTRCALSRGRSFACSLARSLARREWFRDFSRSRRRSVPTVRSGARERAASIASEIDRSHSVGGIAEVSPTSSAGKTPLSRRAHVPAQS